MKVADIAVRHNGNARAIDALDQIVVGENLKMMNPIVLVGECGTGKSYILKALCDVLRLAHGESSVKWMRCEKLVDLYIEALQSGLIQNFRNSLTVGVKALLIDDVDFLLEKPAAAFELTQRIEELVQMHVSVVLASSVSVKKLRNDKATRQFGSRIAQGIEIILSAPDASGCKAIIASVCDTLPQAIQDAIVESFDGDLHSLVGQVHNAMLDAHLEQKQEIGK